MSWLFIFRKNKWYIFRKNYKGVLYFIDMNKKITLSIVLIFLASLAVFVSATMTPTSPLEGYNKVNYNVEIQVQKGWNLIVMSPIVWGSGNNAIASDSEIQKSNIKAIYYLFRSEKKYLQVYPNGQEVENYLRNAQEKPDEALYFAQSPAWVYSDKEGILKYSRHDFPTGAYPKLSAGYNFITLPAGKSINQIKGDCTIEKVYGWLSSDQKWLEETNLDEPIKEMYEGIGMAIEVSSDCQMSETIGGGNINPPQVPQ
jgi:hypothetical protein